MFDFDWYNIEKIGYEVNLKWDNFIVLKGGKIVLIYNMYILIMW